MARRVLVMRLKRVDFPTLGRPTSTTVGAREARFEAMSKVYLGPELTACKFLSIVFSNFEERLSMIKADIVNEVSKVADITKVKAEVAVDAVFDAMRLSMQRGERIELRGFGVFQVKPASVESAVTHGPARKFVSPGPDDPLQTGKGPSEYRRVIPPADLVERPPLYRSASPAAETDTPVGPVWRVPEPPRRFQHVVWALRSFLLTLATTTLVGADHYAAFLSEFSSKEITIDGTCW